MITDRRAISEHRRYAARHGLTLIELLVVLLILAVLATVALRATENYASEARYDATVSQLDEIYGAVLGTANVSGVGEPGLREPGFISDLGRPPIPDLTQIAGRRLIELFEPGDLPVFELRGPDTSDARFNDSIRLACGWRGPYLRFGVNRDEIVDGWGRAFITTRATVTNPQTNMDEEWLEFLESYGSDGQQTNPGSPTARAYEFDLPIQPIDLTALSDVTVNLLWVDDLGELRADFAQETQIDVFFFSPPLPGASDDTVLRVEERSPVSDSANTVTLAMSPGRRVVQAYAPVGAVASEQTGELRPYRIIDVAFDRPMTVDLVVWRHPDAP